jgi:hypothetical protein
MGPGTLGGTNVRQAKRAALVWALTAIWCLGAGRQANGTEEG